MESHNISKVELRNLQMDDYDSSRVRSSASTATRMCSGQRHKSRNL